MRSRILIAPDKFKGSISSPEVCRILKKQIHSITPNPKVESCPLADGGDGSIDILATYMNLKKQYSTAVDPLGRMIESTYYTSEKTAYIELASASGLVLLEGADQNPMRTSTLGTGLQILDALEKGIEHIYLFLGGSATNDGGIGIAYVLGYRFYDKNENELKPIGSSLKYITRINPPIGHVNIRKITLCYDVENTPFGPDGAAFVYAKQKGANNDEIIQLDVGIENLCKQLQKYNGSELSNLAGGGAAGGVAVCLCALFGAELISGLDLISKASMLEFKIANSDIVISGEGRLDKQSLNGKVVSGVAEICKKYGKRLWLVVGKNELSKVEIEQLGVENIYAVSDYAHDLKDAIGNVHRYVEVIGTQIGTQIGTGINPN